jgi:hypothetical protein
MNQYCDIKRIKRALSRPNQIMNTELHGICSSKEAEYPPTVTYPFTDLIFVRGANTCIANTNHIPHVCNISISVVTYHQPVLQHQNNKMGTQQPTQIMNKELHSICSSQKAEYPPTKSNQMDCQMPRGANSCIEYGKSKPNFVAYQITKQLHDRDA